MVELAPTATASTHRAARGLLEPLLRPTELRVGARVSAAADARVEARVPGAVPAQQERGRRAGRADVPEIAHGLERVRHRRRQGEGPTARDLRGLRTAGGQRTHLQEILGRLHRSVLRVADVDAVEQQGVQRGGRRGAATAVPVSERRHVQDPGASSLGCSRVSSLTIHNSAVRGSEGGAALVTRRCLERRLLKRSL
ncbi:hypothetical protein GQ600_16062 [Phytophthora cactorum]|nr:hypothetical protein GQ600_16062 [Phytophthora cactorum]